jgi:hypothetical protein
MARNNYKEAEETGPSSIDTLAGPQNTTPKLKRGEALKNFGINTTARRNKKLAAKNGVAPVANG